MRAVWLLALPLSLIVAIGPLATNDGPVHLSFARLLWLGPDGPLQNTIYAVDLRLLPNLIAYLLAGPLLAAFGSEAAESFLQILCLVGLPLAGMFAARNLRQNIGIRGSADFLVPGFAAFALNQMFFLGLYNFSLSIMFSLLAFGALLNAMRAGGIWYLALAGGTTAAFLSHAAGLIFILVLTACWVLPAVGQDFFKGEKLFWIVRRYMSLFMCFLPSSLLLVCYALQGRSSKIQYGPHFMGRIYKFVRLDIFATNGPLARLAPTLIGAMVLTMAGLAIYACLRRCRTEAQARLDILRFSLMLLSTFGLYLAFPDTAGGGWTHSRRFALLVWLAVMLIAASYDGSERPRLLAFLAGSLAFTMMIVAVAYEQYLIRDAIREADILLEKIGPNCTVLPLITDPKNIGRRKSDTAYSPLYHVATRVEQERDRVALFNFLARLEAYPVRYQPGHDLSQLIFRWLPQQQDSAIRHADPSAFEQATGILVHYVLSQGPMDDLPLSVRRPLEDYRLAGESADTRLRLYQRREVAERGHC